MKSQSKKPKERVLTVQHTSLQFSDSADEMSHDAAKLFGRGKDILTGTEAAGHVLRPILKSMAPAYGYRIHIEGGGDTWVAFKRDLITRGTWEGGYIPVIQVKEGVGHHSQKGITWASAEIEGIGKLTVGAGHYLTKGRHQGEPNYELNTRYTREIGKWGREAGKGRALVLYAGDQNIVDKTDDTFRGQPFTSAWDELGGYEGTGHGNIDVVASYDSDGRVKAEYIRALDDREFRLYSDHFLVDAAFRIRLLDA